MSGTTRSPRSRFLGGRFAVERIRWRGCPLFEIRGLYEALGLVDGDWANGMRIQVTSSISKRESSSWRTYSPRTTSASHLPTTSSYVRAPGLGPGVAFPRRRRGYWKASIRVDSRAPGAPIRRAYKRTDRAGRDPACPMSWARRSPGLSPPHLECPSLESSWLRCSTRSRIGRRISIDRRAGAYPCLRRRLQ